MRRPPNRQPRLRLPVAVMLTALVVGIVAAPATATEWKTYERCTLIKHPSNDGDSFHVRAGAQHYIFRLYFVDAPETDTSFPKRVSEQAAYWGVPEASVTELGKEAAAFTKRYLARGFTVHTRRTDARGRSDRPRYFAMIETHEGFLSKALVSAGLARIYGAPTELPDGKASSRYFGDLRVAERAAKRAKEGAWGRVLSTLELMRRRSMKAR